MLGLASLFSPPPQTTPFLPLFAPLGLASRQRRTQPLLLSSHLHDSFLPLFAALASTVPFFHFSQPSICPASSCHAPPHSATPTDCSAFAKLAAAGYRFASATDLSLAVLRRLRTELNCGVTTINNHIHF